jgi:hypothetical protein
MLGAWIYQVALMPQNECIIIRKEIDEVVLFPVNDADADADESSATEVTPTTSSTPFFNRDYIDPEPSETPTSQSGSDIVSQIAFTREEQEQAMITEATIHFRTLFATFKYLGSCDAFALQDHKTRWLWNWNYCLDGSQSKERRETNRHLFQKSCWSLHI